MAVAVENARRGHAALHIVHALLPDEGASGLEDAQRRVHALQATAAARLGPDVLAPRAHLRIGPFAETIVQLARSLDADLLVVGTHSHGGVKRAIIGSVAEAVVRTAPCTVVVARPKEH